MRIVHTERGRPFNRIDDNAAHIARMSLIWATRILLTLDLFPSKK